MILKYIYIYIYIVTNIIHNNTYSDEIFRHYRLIKFAPKFPSTGAHFSDHNSDEIYFSSLNVIIFFKQLTAPLIHYG